MSTLRPSSRKQLMLQLLNKRNRAQHPISKGFTLIELLVVIVILGVLGAVGYQAYLNQLARANEAVASTTAVAIAKSCAASLVIGEEGTWTASDLVDTTRVTLGGSGDTCANGSAWTVTVGTGDNERTCEASVGADGAVTPEGCTAAATPAPGPAPAPAPATP